MNEPRLDSNDHACWSRLQILARQRARTVEHRRLVEAAKRVASRSLEQATRPAVMWSAGKDSTALAHLVTVELGADVPLMSEKDDLDYPGEEDYVRHWAAAWGARLEIIRPDVSPSQWVAEHAQELTPGSDFHSRAAGLSKACFYDVVERANAERDLVFLGLRAEESPGRAKNRHVHGLTYTRKARPGQVMCSPLGDWTGLDVYAYLEVRGVEPLHVYRCIGFMHSREPWRVRKSWWLPGGSSNLGGIAWLRRYYPSLYRQMVEWFPRAQSLG